MNENKQNEVTELVMILDKSGSMGGLESDTIGGYNGMMEKQRKAGVNALVTTVLFNNEAVTIHDRVPIANMPKMTGQEYQTGGCTALLDAVGQTISRVKLQHARDGELAPKRTMVVITTDGLENASREYSYTRVKKLIEQQKEEGWEFIFLGANIDAAAEAERIGIRRDHAARYMNDEEGIEENYKALNDVVQCYACRCAYDPAPMAQVQAEYKRRSKASKDKQ